MVRLKRMTSVVAKHEEKAAKHDVPARERYKSRREDRKSGAEEMETIRTDEIFTKRSDSALAVRTCSLLVDPRLPESALFSRVRSENSPLPMRHQIHLF